MSKRANTASNARRAEQRRAASTVLMLLTNAYDPDPRVRQEALALIRKGWRVRLLCWDRDLKSAPEECIEGVEVERVFLASRHGRGNTQLLFYAWLYLKMFWRAWRMNFDVVHCHDLDTVPLGYLAGRLKRKPVFYDAHESFPDMLESSVHPLVQRFVKRADRFFVRRVDLLITVGEKLRRHFEEMGARRSVVVGNWKRLEEFRRTPEQNLEVRRKLGIPEGAFAVVCITNLLKDRKIEELLQAVEDCPGVYAIIGGKGALEELVRQKAAKNPRIIYIGFVRAQDVPAYTGAADAVYYGFDPANPNARFSAPNKLFEALAAGRPLITGDFGEIGDVVRRGACGILLPSYTAAAVQGAIESLQDPSVWSSCARNAALLGRTEMNWEKGEANLFGEYSRLVGSSGQALPEEVHAGDERALEIAGTERQR